MVLIISLLASNAFAFPILPTVNGPSRAASVELAVIPSASSIQPAIPHLPGPHPALHQTGVPLRTYGAARPVQWGLPLPVGPIPANTHIGFPALPNRPLNMIHEALIRSVRHPIAPIPRRTLTPIAPIPRRTLTDGLTDGGRRLHKINMGLVGAGTLVGVGFGIKELVDKYKD